MLARLRGPAIGAASRLPALLALALMATSAAAAISNYQYLSPVPAAHLVRAKTNVIVRYGLAIKATTIRQELARVAGSVSGTHSGVLALSDDGKTVIFTPDAPFAAGDSVDFQLLSGIKTTTNMALPSLRFYFYVSPQAVPTGAAPSAIAAELPPLDRAAALSAPAPGSRTQDDWSLPGGYLPVAVVSSDHPEPGAIFIDPFSTANGFGTGGTLAIVDNYGNPLYWKQLAGETGLDFKLQPDGRLVYIGATHAYVMDSSYAVVDSFTTGNGYAIDGHDSQLLPNGHRLLLSYDPQPVRMDSVVAGGSPNAIVQGLVIQELDLARRVVFQWRSWDWIPITDCNSGTQNLTGNNIDYVHGNAVDLDSDGNLLVSSRHLSEITKINHSTGAVMWRMGLNATRNQFAFTNDTRGFSHQHDIRRLPNGDITLYDNGNFLDPQYSRAVEYRIDENAKTATKVWEYETPDVIFGGFMGNVQRRSTGAQTICWGGVFGSPERVADFHPDGSLGLELGLDPSTFSYRAYRYPWRTTLIAPDRDSLEFGVVTYNSFDPTTPVVVRNRAARSVTIAGAPCTSSRFYLASPLPITLAPGGSVTVHVAFHPDSIGTFAGRLYLRSVDSTEVVAGAIDLHAVSQKSTDVVPAVPVAFALHPVTPNPVRGAMSFAFDLPRAGRATLELFTVDGRRVATVAAREFAAGRHVLGWQSRGLPGGVYFVRLTAAGDHATRRFVHVE